jgi:hypothetical protein
MDWRTKWGQKSTEVGWPRQTKARLETRAPATNSRTGTSQARSARPCFTTRWSTEQGSEEPVAVHFVESAGSDRVLAETRTQRGDRAFGGDGRAAGGAAAIGCQPEVGFSPGPDCREQE